MSLSFSNCPHCNKIVTKKSMTDNHKYRSEKGIDIFACPHCNGHFKVDPYEYLKAKKSGNEVKLYKVNELLKCEKMADSMFDWSGYPIKVAIGLALFAVIFLISG